MWVKPSSSTGIPAYLSTFTCPIFRDSYWSWKTKRLPEKRATFNCLWKVKYTSPLIKQIDSGLAWSVYIDDDIRQHSGQNLSWTHSAVPRFYHNINLEMSESSMLESWLRIARHVDASSVVHTLVNNGKLANQIAKVTASWGKITYSWISIKFC